MQKTPITIQDLFPNLSPEEQKLAEENLRRYVEIVVQIAYRLDQAGTLTLQDSPSRMEDKRSNHYQNPKLSHEA
jgi:hypothetical protein